jgi:TRAP-type C4-dicarboxylate transport system permease small subunit
LSREQTAAAQGALDRAVAKAARAAAALGGIVVFAVMLASVADVLLRFFGAPLPSTYELVQFAMVLVVWCGVAWCGLAGGHVALNLLGGWLDRRGARWLNASVHLAGAALFALIAWRSAHEALRYLASGEVTNMLRAPFWPFMAVTAAGAALYALVLLLDARRALVRGGAREP